MQDMDKMQESQAKKTPQPIASKDLLKQAFMNNVVSLKKAHTTYKENVVAVNTLVTGVLTSKLPVLQNPPPSWNQFTSTYETANSDALGWVNNVMGELLSVPDDVKNYNGVISNLLQDAKTQTNSLISNPSDEQALNILRNDLARVSQQLNMVSMFITNTISNITKFQDKLPDMATQLQNIADLSSKEAKADQAQIDKLKADIVALQKEIKTLTAEIVALGIADAALISLGVLASIVAWPEGMLAWFIFGPAVIATTTVIALDGAKITSDKKKIKSDQDQMSSLTADVSTLHLLAQHYNQLATESAEIETNLKMVLAEWQTLESDINTAIADIRSAHIDVAVPNYQAVLGELNGAIAEWNKGYTQANSLHLDLNVNNAQLTIGMSDSEVRSALNSGTKMGLIEYYNSVA